MGGQVDFRGFHQKSAAHTIHRDPSLANQPQWIELIETNQISSYNFLRKPEIEGDKMLQSWKNSVLYYWLHSENSYFFEYCADKTREDESKIFSLFAETWN